MSELSAVTCVTAVPGLLKRTWPAEQSAAVYVPASGRTHLVSALAFEVLQQTDARGQSLGHLVDRIFGQDASDALQAAPVQPQDPGHAEDEGQIPVPEPESGVDGNDLDRLIEAAQGLIQAGLLLTVRCP